MKTRLSKRKLLLEGGWLVKTIENYVNDSLFRLTSSSLFQRVEENSVPGTFVLGTFLQSITDSCCEGVITVISSDSEGLFDPLQREQST